MASVTINFSAANATRIQDAFTRRLKPVDGEGEPRAATVADYKEWVLDATRKVVHQSERQAADEAVSNVDLPLT